MGVFKADDLNPDGVRIIVDWDALRVGSSVFIPCINVPSARKQVKEVFARRGWKMRTRTSPESNVWGVRVWRVA